MTISDTFFEPNLEMIENAFFMSIEKSLLTFCRRFTIESLQTHWTFLGKICIIFFQRSWKVHFISFIDLVQTSCLILSNRVIVYCEAFSNKCYKWFLLNINKKKPRFVQVETFQNQKNKKKIWKKNSWMIWLSNYILLFSHEDLIINQRKLMFKTNIACEPDF